MEREGAIRRLLRPSGLLLPMLIGIVLVSLYMAPFYWFGENAYVQIWDYYDVLVVNRAYANDHVLRHCFEGIAMMNGADVARHAPLLYDWPYVFWSPFYAATVNEHWYRILGFAGMFLLLGSRSASRLPAFLAALLFALFPYIYYFEGSIASIPLLLYLLGKAMRSPHFAWWHYALVAWIGLTAQAYYIGYWLYPFLFACACVALARQYRTGDDRKQARTRALRLIIFYAVLGLATIYQHLPLLSGFAETLHREEITRPVLHPVVSVAEHAWLTYKGVDHIFPYTLVLLPAALLSLAAGACLIRCNPALRRLLLLQLVCLATTVLLAVLTSVFGTMPLVGWLSELVRGFNFGRFSWALPVVWAVSFYLSLRILEETGRALSLKKPLVPPLLVLAFAGVQFCGLASTTLNGNLHRPFTWTLRLFADPAPSPDNALVARYNRFVDHDLFGQIREALPPDRGSYNVGSIGLYPCIASYEGFSTIDGLSVSYLLEHKHAMMRVMRNELKKDPGLDAFFSTWGHYCFLFSSELPYNDHASYLVARGSKGPIAPDYDTGALRELNCRYIFSAVPVANHRELGWSFVRLFSSPDSLYEVYVYQVF